jgi:hypothetical protein
MRTTCMQSIRNNESTTAEQIVCHLCAMSQIGVSRVVLQGVQLLRVYLYVIIDAGLIVFLEFQWKSSNRKGPNFCNDIASGKNSTVSMLAF